MITSGKVFPAGETALILRQMLGNLRSWDDALADMRKGKTSVYGFVLKPVGTMIFERAKRPVYAAHHIREFILSVGRASGRLLSRLPPQGLHASFDESINWRHQHLAC